MATPEIRRKIQQEIKQLPSEKLALLSEFLDFLKFKSKEVTSPLSSPTKRKGGLHLGAFVVSDDFDAPLPDSFWLGEEG